MDIAPSSSTTTIPERDVPRILLPPPVIPLTMLVASIALQRLVPLGWLTQATPAWRIVVGVALALAGGSMINLGRLALRRRGTNVNPYRPTLAIATDGVFARTRNPIYVGGLTLTVGVAVASGLDWLLLLQPVGIAVLHVGVVQREECYLERKFGEPYRAYKATVRRYV